MLTSSQFYPILFLTKLTSKFYLENKIRITWFPTSTMYIQIFNHNISLQKQHGKPTNVDSRHVGDLGNIVTPAGRFTLVKNLYQSLTPVSLFDGLISLDAEAENGIAGRAIVVHAGEDDLGMNYFGRD